MSCNSGHCTNCNGCNKADKPKDCKGNSCGRCCNKQKNNDFLLILLEKQFLPFVYVDDEVFYKNNATSTKAEIKQFQETITLFNSLGYLTIDYNIELDEYSYLDYNNIFDLFNMNKENIKKGTISITQKCFDTFIKKDNVNSSN